MEVPITTGNTSSFAPELPLNDVVSDSKPQREVLDRVLQLIVDLAQRHDYQDIHRRAQDLVSRVKDSTLNVVVLGEFKRGKSSLINALLGANVLPTAVVPATSIVSVVKFGNIPKAYVELQSGYKFYVALEKIDEYITENLNPSNHKEVKQVEIEYPAKLLSKNIQLIDTPGIGSIYLHNTQTTRTFLEQADAVLFVFSADQPATETELALLKESSAFSVHTFLIQNKADQLLQEELEDSKRFLEYVISKEFQDHKTKIYAVSARQVLETINPSIQVNGNLFDFCSLCTDFEAFAAYERRQAFIESAIIHARLLLTQIEQRIQMDVELLSISRTELEEASVLLQVAVKDISLSQEMSAGHWISLDFKESIDRLEKKLRQFCMKQQSTIHLGMKGPYCRFILEQLLQPVFEQWNRQAEEEISAAFEQITMRFYERAKVIAIPISKLVSELLQRELLLEFEPVDTKFVIDYWVSAKGELLEWLLPVLPFFIREFVLIYWISTEMKSHSYGLVNHIRQLLEEKVQEFVHNFKIQVEQFVSQTQDSLAKALQRQELVAERLGELRESVSVDLLLIERMKKELDMSQ